MDQVRRIVPQLGFLLLAVYVLPLLTIEHDTAGHTLAIKCYLTRAVSNLKDGTSCMALIDAINHDSSMPYLIVGEDAGLVAAQVDLYIVTTMALFVLALLPALVFELLLLYIKFDACLWRARLASWQAVALSAAICTGALALDASQRWSREHDGATPTESATYASVGGGCYVVVVLPVFAVLESTARAAPKEKQ